MVKRGVILTPKDAGRTEQSVRWVERNRNLRHRMRPKNLQAAGGNYRKAFARIIQTLQRQDLELGLPKINWYEIELLSWELEFWSASHGTYFEGDIRKYTVGDTAKIFECTVEHPSNSAIPPTNTSYWKEATATKAWVFGYAEDLIEAVPWFQPGDIVEVVKYEDPRFADREWWILKTVIRVQTGSDENIKCSLYWLQEEDGTTEKRCASVYR